MLKIYSRKPSIQEHNENWSVYLPIQVQNIRDAYQMDLIVLVKSKAKVKDHRLFDLD
jgi:hypothetical protein